MQGIEQLEIVVIFKMCVMEKSLEFGFIDFTFRS